MSDRATDAIRLRTILAVQPDDRVAWHNLASAEGDLGRAMEAEAAARRAIALGIAAPETRLVLARALQSQPKLDEAERMFRKAIAMRPTYADAQRDLAQLTWMRSGRADYALRKIEQTLRDAPAAASLHLIKSTVLEFAGDLDKALAAAITGLTRSPHDIPLLRQASHLHAQIGDAANALTTAERAARLAPADAGAQTSVCEALMGVGRPVEAESLAAGICAAQPFNQYAIALRATAWRLLSDSRYLAVSDYQSLLNVESLGTPDDQLNLSEFLNGIASELEGLHSFVTHPLQQSVRGGSQLSLQSEEMARPLIRTLFEIIQGSVQSLMKKLGGGQDPVRSRNTYGARITGAWSIRLRSGGHHADHVHPHGWLSSACYIALPPTIGAGTTDDDRAGWLRFGRPPFKTDPPLAADYFVKPQPGLLVLFPAYIWHGVEPFFSERPRLSVAFDVVPA